LFECILADKPHREIVYRSCLVSIRRAGQDTPTRMEAAAERALLAGAFRYQNVKSMVENSAGSLTAAGANGHANTAPPPQDNIEATIPASSTLQGLPHVFME
jgi:hypothetical protein